MCLYFMGFFLWSHYLALSQYRRHKNQAVMRNLRWLKILFAVLADPILSAEKIVNVFTSHNV
jgi:hypothetical protein